MFVDLPPSISAIRAGKLRVLAVATPQRLPILPDVPTMAEAGVPGFEAYAWQGFVGPAHLSPALTERLNKSLATALRHRSEEHTSELQSHLNLVCRLLLEKKKTTTRLHSRTRAAARERQH